eukprot:6175288-Pleurochrysis_carterae.AAC.5
MAPANKPTKMQIPDSLVHLIFHLFMTSSESTAATATSTVPSSSCSSMLEPPIRASRTRRCAASRNERTTLLTCCAVCTGDFNLLAKNLPIGQKRIPASDPRHPDRTPPHSASKMTTVTKGRNGNCAGLVVVHTTRKLAISNERVQIIFKKLVLIDN